MLCEICGTTLRTAHGSMHYCDSCQQWRTTSRQIGWYCARCGERIENQNAAAAWNLDGSETAIHADIRECIRTNPDNTSPILRFKSVVGRTFDEPRMTGALDPERGWYR